MSKITATQAEPNEPEADAWRPTSIDATEAKQRAEFLKGWNEPANDKPKAKAAPIAADDADLDEPDDEDEEADDEDDEEADAVTAAPPKKPAKKPVERDEPDEDEEKDDDSDLDEDDEEDEDKAEADPVVAKGLAKLQKQERRQREQLDREREAARAAVAKERAEVQAEREAAKAATAKYEKLATRAKLDPLGVLEELGVDDFEYVGKAAYIRTKAAADPAHKEVAARMQKERELASKVAELEKRAAEREKADEDEKKNRATREQINAYLGNIAKEAPKVAKAALTQRLLASDPDYAKRQFGAVASALWDRDGVEPTARKVILHVEKLERAALRRFGIDPRALVANDEETTTTKPTGKAATAKPKPIANGKKPAVRPADDDEDLKFPTKSQLLKEDWSS